MKKLVVITLMLFGFSSTAFAQPGKGDIQYGFGLGYNFSGVYVENEGSTDAGSGVNVAVSADYYFSDRWSLKAKLIYDQKGWNNGFVDNSDPFDPNMSGYYKTNFNLNYLTVPVTMNWNFGKKRNWYINLGPYAGFLLSAKETEKGTSVKDYFVTTDFGIAWGVGVKIPVSDKTKIFIEYQEQYGLSNIFDDNSDLKGHNSRGSFNVGVNFELK